VTVAERAKPSARLVMTVRRPVHAVLTCDGCGRGA
jgi:hypothetical protein